jgi:MerR family transcriptional regulator/heat shock protein HspR
VTNDVGRHPIRRAAEISGIHPQTLREYERRGLLKPARTEGGMRLYRDGDIDAAKRVRELTEEGLPFHAVERMVRLERRVATLIERIRVLEDQNVRLSDRLIALSH